MQQSGRFVTSWKLATTFCMVVCFTLLKYITKKSKLTLSETKNILQLNITWMIQTYLLLQVTQTIVFFLFFLFKEKIKKKQHFSPCHQTENVFFTRNLSIHVTMRTLENFKSPPPPLVLRKKIQRLVKKGHTHKRLTHVTHVVARVVSK